jgi:two-component system chemotaxis response regulator CheB
LEGSKAIARAGGHVLAESAESCVVYGMPRSVIEQGVATAQAPLDGLPALLLRTLGKERLR